MNTVAMYFLFYCQLNPFTWNVPSLFTVFAHIYYTIISTQIGRLVEQKKWRCWFGGTKNWFHGTTIWFHETITFIAKNWIFLLVITPISAIDNILLLTCRNIKNILGRSLFKNDKTTTNIINLHKIQCIYYRWHCLLKHSLSASITNGIN